MYFFIQPNSIDINHTENYHPSQTHLGLHRVFWGGNARWSPKNKPQYSIHLDIENASNPESVEGSLMEHLHLFSIFYIDYGSILYLESSSLTGHTGMKRRWSRGTKTLGTRETRSSHSFSWRIVKCAKFARKRSSLRHCPTAAWIAYFHVLSTTWRH